MAGASESLHESLDQLSSKTLDMHRALVSLQEELEAVDWYRQRADGCSDSELREILLHNMREEMEHAAMVLEWLRRNDADMAENLQTYLFTSAPVTEVEGSAMGDEAGGEETPAGGPTIGSLKGES